MRLADDKIDDTMVIAIDPGDMMKPYAKSMEYLCNIYDGSEYAWAIDRQGDDIDLIRNFTNESLQFVTRLKMNRYLHFGKNRVRQVKAERIDRHVELRHKAHIYVAKEGKEEFIHLNYVAITVALPEYTDIWYMLVIVKGFGQQPMLLLTNKQLWQIIEIYLTRWKCDECYRYIKQSYNMEDFRVMGYNSIRNITVLVHAIAYFTSIYLGISIKLRIMVQKIFILSKRFFGVPSFYNYAMADGIVELLRHSKEGIISVCP